MPEEQSKLDMQTSDLLHYAENNNLSAPQCCKFVKELQKVRRKRRIVKDDYDLLNAYRTHINKITGKANREFLISEVAKVEKQHGSKYKNRIYEEKELNEVLGVGNNKIKESN